MNSRPDHLFALSDIEPLLREELGCVPAHAARQPGGRALLLQACVENRDLAIDTRHLGLVRMHAQQNRFGGDAICATAALPWEDAAFQLIVAQHVGDVLPDAAGLAGECARVLAPGGVLLWFGLNPWSPWLAWAHWQARGALSTPCAVHADPARRLLARQRLVPAELAYIGTCWPQHGSRLSIHRSLLLAPLRGAYLITAAKQRATLTPLRAWRPRARGAAQPQLAMPSRRACA